MGGGAQGRGGLGSIYVWASGDGGHNDDCNCDGYAASMWTISINSATNDGQTASYDESCSSTLASTFSNGKSGYQDAGVVSLPPLSVSSHLSFPLPFLPFRLLPSLFSSPFPSFSFSALLSIPPTLSFPHVIFPLPISNLFSSLPLSLPFPSSVELRYQYKAV